MLLLALIRAGLLLCREDPDEQYCWVPLAQVPPRATDADGDVNMRAQILE